VENATTQLPPHNPHNHTKPVSNLCVDMKNNFVLAESPKDGGRAVSFHHMDIFQDLRQMRGHNRGLPRLPILCGREEAGLP